MSYARGKYAFGICDRTGFRYPIEDLVYEFTNGKRNGLRVGRDVADKDHPQNFVGQIKSDDPQSIIDADKTQKTSELFKALQEWFHPKCVGWCKRIVSELLCFCMCF